VSERQLRLICREYDGFEKAFGIQADRFAEKTGIRIARDFIEVHTLYEQMVAGSGAKGETYDLMLAVTDWLPELIAGGALTPLNDFLRADPPDDWPHGWSPSMLGQQTAADGTIYGVPYHDGPEVLHYRVDLFEDPKEQAAFRETYGYDLAPPRTWSQFLDVAKHFNRPDEGLRGSVVAYYPDAHNNVYDFLIHLWSRGGALVTPDWKPAFNSPIGVEALQYYVDLLHVHGVVSKECLELDSVGSGYYFAEGKAALMWNWCGFAALSQTPEVSRIVDKNLCTLVPRGDGAGGEHISLNIYWVLTIPAGSRNKEAAYQFIKHTASAAMDRVTSLSGGTGTRLSTWRDPELCKQFHYYREIEEVHKNVKSPLPIPEGAQLIEILNTMVDDAVKGRSSVPDALARAEKDVAALLRNAGYDDPARRPSIPGY